MLSREDMTVLSTDEALKMTDGQERRDSGMRQPNSGGGIGRVARVG